MELISPWFLYLWTRLDSLAFASGLFATLFLIVGGVYLVFFAVAYFSDDIPEEKMPTIVRLNKWVIGIFLTLSFMTLSIPSSKDAAIIYIIPKIANNENIQEEAKELYDYAITAMKEYLPKVKEDVQK